MNLSEFKAWFEGFTEAIDRPPTAKQWKRIKERVDEITPEPTPWPVFVERYVQPYHPWWPNYVCGTTTVMQSDADLSTNWDGGTAFYNVGRLDAELLTAN